MAVSEEKTNLRNEHLKTFGRYFHIVGISWLIIPKFLIVPRAASTFHLQLEVCNAQYGICCLFYSCVCSQGKGINILDLAFELELSLLCQEKNPRFRERERTCPKSHSRYAHTAQCGKQSHIFLHTQDYFTIHSFSWWGKQIKKKCPSPLSKFQKPSCLLIVNTYLNKQL